MSRSLQAQALLPAQQRVAPIVGKNEVDVKAGTGGLPPDAAVLFGQEQQWPPPFLLFPRLCRWAEGSQLQAGWGRGGNAAVASQAGLAPCGRRMGMPLKATSLLNVVLG